MKRCFLLLLGFAWATAEMSFAFGDEDGMPVVAFNYFDRVYPVQAEYGQKVEVKVDGCKTCTLDLTDNVYAKLDCITKSNVQIHLKGRYAEVFRCPCSAFYILWNGQHNAVKRGIEHGLASTAGISYRRKELIESAWGIVGREVLLHGDVRKRLAQQGVRLVRGKLVTRNDSLNLKQFDQVEIRPKNDTVSIDAAVYRGKREQFVIVDGRIKLVSREELNGISPALVRPPRPFEQQGRDGVCAFVDSEGKVVTIDCDKIKTIKP